MKYLVDTNVLSELNKPMPDARVVDWMFKYDADIVVSVVTLGELDRGVQSMRRGLHRKNLVAWFNGIQADLVGKVLPVTQATMQAWASLYTGVKTKDLPFFDSLLAATAVHHGLTVVTRNVGDFPKGVKVLNPWKA